MNKKRVDTIYGINSVNVIIVVPESNAKQFSYTPIDLREVQYMKAKKQDPSTIVNPNTM